MNRSKSLYKTTNSSYNPYWTIFPENEQPIDIAKANIPSYSEIGKKLSNLERTRKLLKNDLVAKKHAEKRNIEMNELDAFKKKIDKNAIVSKKFPTKPDNYKIPPHGLNIGNPLYMTSYMDVGRLKPTGFEIPEKYYPMSRNFTNDFSGGNFKFNGLNTAITFSKVHTAYNEF